MATAPRKSRGTVSRRFSVSHMRKGFKRHVRLVGEVVWAWNELHLAFACAFSALIEDQPLVGNAIWVALKNESAQRDALENSLYWSNANRGQRRALSWALVE